MNLPLSEWMLEVTRLTRRGRLLEATALIQRGLGGGEFPANSAVVPAAPDAADEGFTEGVFTHQALTRRYKLYVPPGGVGQALPLVVMLHGCSQHADDFAAGTGMNRRAAEQGFCVLYPEQATSANPHGCWNWFQHNHQRRDAGEPALIASLTQAVVAAQGLDASRVYIAGLSAGGAMAVIVANNYPELFAAVGVHSGLPQGAASDVMSALEVMKNGPSAPIHASGVGGGQSGSSRVPTVVFHGDADATVHPRNGDQVVTEMLQSGAAQNGTRLPPTVEQGQSPQGRHYTCTTHTGATGEALAEHWLVHGAGHAWSGGQPEGSFTETQGPDATAEMLRFFFSRRLSA